MNGLNSEGSASGTLRLLPWSDREGKPSYVIGDGTGYVSRMADRVERLQLAMAVELLGHAGDMVADEKTTSDQLRYLVARMAEALHDVHRIAESRGARLPEPAHDDGEAADDLDARDTPECQHLGDTATELMPDA